MHLLSNNFLQRLHRIAIIAALGFGLLAFAPSVSVQAQAPAAGGASKTVSLNLNQQPVQTALRLLFSSMGYNNSIDQDVQGLVTINVNGVSFDTALNTLLRSTNPPLTYDLQGGVYHVSVKPTAPPPTAATDQTPPPTTTAVDEGVHAYRIPIDHYDAYMIAELVAGVEVSSGSNNQNGGGFGGNNGRRNGGQNGNSNPSVLMVPANDVLASGGTGVSQSGGFGGQNGGFGGQQGGFGGGFGGGQQGGFGGGSSFGGGGFGGQQGGFGGGGFGGF